MEHLIDSSSDDLVNRLCPISDEHADGGPDDVMHLLSRQLVKYSVRAS